MEKESLANFTGELRTGYNNGALALVLITPVGSAQ